MRLVNRIMAVVLLPFLIVLLPESLVKEDARLTIPAAKLFSDGRTRFTILIWIIFFANLMELYILTSWLPTTIRACAGALRRLKNAPPAVRA